MSEELWKTHCATLQAMLMSGAKQLHEAEMENARLKAEVERLEKEVWRMKMLNDIDGDTIKGLKVALKTDPEWAKVLEAIENNARLEAENRELKAENERLRKAGDELRDSLPYIVDERLDDKTMRKIMNRWNAAKEGKPQS